MLRLTHCTGGGFCGTRERRAEFKVFLDDERKKMELFRLREIKEFLSLDELKEKCDIADEHMDMLEV